MAQLAPSCPTYILDHECPPLQHYSPSFPHFIIETKNGKEKVIGPRYKWRSLRHPALLISWTTNVRLCSISHHLFHILLLRRKMGKKKSSDPDTNGAACAILPYLYLGPRMSASAAFLTIFSTFYY